MRIAARIAVIAAATQLGVDDAEFQLPVGFVEAIAREGVVDQHVGRVVSRSPHALRGEESSSLLLRTVREDSTWFTPLNVDFAVPAEDHVNVTER